MGGKVSLIAAAMLFVSTSTGAQRLEFSGNVGYQASGSNAVLRADRINYICPSGFSGTSGTIRMELWATASPFSCSGSISGYRTATYTLPSVLNCGGSYVGVSSGTVPFTAPPGSHSSYSMLLSEFNNGGFFWDDCVAFSGGGANNGNLVNVTCQSSTITIKFWDNQGQDGDIVNITLNGSPLVSNFNLNQCGGPAEPQSGPCVITRSLTPNSSNTLRVTALNEGMVSPNTAALKVIGSCVPLQQAWELLTGQSAQITVTAGGGTGVAVPGAPTNVFATALNGAASVSFSAPASNGGASITGYTVTSSPGSVSAFIGGTSGTVTGLTNGVTYTFTVRARNSAGDGPSSLPSNPVTPGGTPLASVPGAPTNVVASALNGAASVSFSPPLNNGGASITGYTVTSAPGGVSAFFGGTSGTVAGLTNGVTYTFTVRARNSVGDGPASAPSNPVTPAGATSPAVDRAFDLNGDGRTDLVWYNSTFGNNYYQLRSGQFITGEGSLLVHPTWRVVTSGDLDADGRGDLLWYNSATGDNYYWLMNGPSPRSQGSLFVHPLWRITHSADLDGDSRSDLLWINPGSGETHAWMMNGVNRTSAGNLLVHPTWRVTHTGDLNGDRRADLVWYNEATGESYYWLMNGMTRLSEGRLLLHPTWRVVATGDLNADGRDDLLWHNRATGESYYWLMNGGTPTSQGTLLVHPSWVITGTADVNGDGRADLLWQNPATGESYLWIMSGVTPSLQLSLSTDFRWRTVNQ